MKGILGASFVFLVSALGISAQTSLSTLIAELPSCALTCLVAAIENSTCALTNQTCICTNAPLQLDVTACVTKSCTIKEGLTTKNITSTSCDDPIRDKSQLYNNLSISLGVITAAVVLLRFASKFVTGSTFWLDDYFIGITLVWGVPSTILSVRGLTPNGLGRDIWTVTFNQITDFGLVFYIMEVLYFGAVVLLKLSLLLFYLRVFPGTRLRQLLWGTVVFNVVYGIVFVFVAIFQCWPIDYYWKKWDGEAGGRCINLNALTWANAAVSIALDIWMISLAMSQVVKLKLHWKKKVGVGLMFIVGTFVTVVSILRLQSLAQFANSNNPTWDNFSVAQWSTIEISVGIMCACMPSLRVLLVHLFPSVLGTSNPSNKGYYVHNSSSRVVGNSSFSQSHRVSTTNPPNKGQIMLSRSYTVDHGTPWERDEMDMEFDDLDAISINSTGPASNTSGRALAKPKTVRLGVQPV